MNLSALFSGSKISRARNRRVSRWLGISPSEDCNCHWFLSSSARCVAPKILTLQFHLSLVLWIFSLQNKMKITCLFVCSVLRNEKSHRGLAYLPLQQLYNCVILETLVLNKSCNIPALRSRKFLLRTLGLFWIMVLGTFVFIYLFWFCARKFREGLSIRFYMKSPPPKKETVLVYHTLFFPYKISRSNEISKWRLCLPNREKHLNSVTWVHERTIPTEDRRLSAKLVPTFADRWCHVVSSVTDPYGRIFEFLDWGCYFFFEMLPQLYSRSRVDPIPDPVLLRISASTGNRTRASRSVARNSDH
jgi:hypothetical protein